MGIDTSCYTTSVALIDNEEHLVMDERIMIKVKAGERGIRQSDAIYQHIENLDVLLEDLFGSFDASHIKAIGVSSKPRNNPDSYMPVFNSGLHIGKVMGLCLKAPLFLLSHQENHILSGLWSQQLVPDKPFLAYHMSGGTTELLLVEGYEKMAVKVIGGSSDLKAGQFIDRLGVAMGLDFPCGKEMDMLSESEKEVDISIPFSVKDSYASFSGPETFAQKIIKSKQYDKAKLSKAVFLCIAKLVEETLVNSKSLIGWEDVLFIGGVSSNSTIIEYLSNSPRLKAYNIKPVFSHKRCATDNALGCAVYAKKNLREKLEG
ncbi:hypothetical protein [Lutispora sp.]|uniref:hypothetical protein n=1 Tax=Lutispora sp. TaxID=2828727 RepID=UPI002B1EA700|nr:hypothetical protein [Lutispora sp.]MEA4963895.1 hypothetical protein [Lutispora sp.]